MINTEWSILPGEQLISPASSQLQYAGRIDFSNNLAPVFIFSYSSIAIRFTGTTVKLLIQNHHQYQDNYIGYTIDGVHGKIHLSNEDSISTITLADELEDKEHNLFIYKRMDACHYFTFHGLIISELGTLMNPPAKPHRKIEFYGDSVTAGEVSEALDYIGKVDPEHNGEYSNSWYSYATITARQLGAQIHNIAQGGIALLDNTGWFHEPDYIGMETAYDKLSYNTAISTIKPWDFSEYTPHVVVVAIGQNDSHPDDYMKDNYYSKRSIIWRQGYESFIQKLRHHYPQATIILTTTILCHAANWDKSIDEVCNTINDPKIHHFLYHNNGIGTPGHIRAPEAEQMANELTSYIESLGDDIWI